MTYVYKGLRDGEELRCLSWNITRGEDEPRGRKEEEQQATKKNQRQKQFSKNQGDNMHEMQHDDMNKCKKR